jgi:hypothetical protein
MAKTTVGFSCDVERDADILAWLERQENKSAAIREAIRSSWLQSGVSLADVLNEIGEVKRMLRSGAIRVESDDGQDETQALDPEQREIQNALDSLGF